MTGLWPPCPTPAPPTTDSPAGCSSAGQSPDPTEHAYYLCYGPADTDDEELIRVAGTRWAIEECFQTAKGQVGLNDYQVRRYDAWYRHITLAMCAHAFLTVTAGRAQKGAPSTGPASSPSASPRLDVSWHT